MFDVAEILGVFPFIRVRNLSLSMSQSTTYFCGHSNMLKCHGLENIVETDRCKRAPVCLLLEVQPCLQGGQLQFVSRWRCIKHAHQLC
eukprot:scaffold219227_cov20-Tisochrysis_lutea.AAC.1